MRLREHLQVEWYCYLMFEVVSMKKSSAYSRGQHAGKLEYGQVCTCAVFDSCPRCIAKGIFYFFSYKAQLFNDEDEIWDGEGEGDGDGDESISISTNRG